MIFNWHGNLEGKHAFLSASKYHWTNYDEEKLISVYRNFLAVQRGTELHDFASKAIRLHIRLPKTQSTLNNYVNDALGFRMTPEVPLYFSENCFGTCDAISFNEKQKILRIHDLKTGDVPANMQQLRIYAALFCHEYKTDPRTIRIILRIYHSTDILEEEADPEEIGRIMAQIVQFDSILERLKTEEAF